MAHRLASSLRRARQEPAAFTDFYAAHSRQLLAFFVRPFDVETARDLTAETFAQTFEHRRRFRGLTDGEACGWVYGIARHQLSRYARNGVVERRAVNRLGIQLPTSARTTTNASSSWPDWRSCATASRPPLVSCRTASATRCACG
jgi:DNA-directed RNA polymerase specialized sigma24 family protein